MQLARVKTLGVFREIRTEQNRETDIEDEGINLVFLLNVELCKGKTPPKV